MCSLNGGVSSCVGVSKKVACIGDSSGMLSGEESWLRLKDLSRPNCKRQNAARTTMKAVLDGDAELVRERVGGGMVTVRTGE